MRIYTPLLSSCGIVHLVWRAFQKFWNRTNPAPQIRNPKSSIGLPGTRLGKVQSDISDFGFEVQDSSNFEIYSARCLLLESSTSGFTTWIGLPAAYAVIWSKISEN